MRRKDRNGDPYCTYESDIPWLGACKGCGRFYDIIRERPQEDVSRMTLATLANIKPPERMSTGCKEMDYVIGGGIVVGSTYVLTGPPGQGKCAAKSVKLLDASTGDFLSVAAWGDRIGHSVASVDEQQLRLRASSTSAFYPQGVRAVVDVRTRLGRVLRVTPDHPFRTLEGWVEAEQLAEGSRIATPRRLPFFGKETMSAPCLKLIAYILGDGGVSTGRAGVTASVPEIVDDLHAIAAYFGVELRVYKKQSEVSREYQFVKPDGVNTVHQFLDQHDLRFLKAGEKKIPPAVFRLRREDLAVFLRALFSTDGSLYFARPDDPGISYSTTSRELAEGVAHLLLRFGFVARIKTKNQTYKGEPYTAYELLFEGVENVRRFVREIGLAGRPEAEHQLAGTPAPKKPSTHRDLIPGGPLFWAWLREAIGGQSFEKVSNKIGVKIENRRHDRPLTAYTVRALAKHYPHPKLAALAEGDVYWDEVVSVTPAGYEEVWDISVPGDQNFVANDVVIHNCLAPETPLLLHTPDHRGRVVQNFQVEVGNRLLGPDGLPRTVLSVTKGRGPLRRIVPLGSSHTWSPWVCNDVHVLTLFDQKTYCLFDIALDEYLRAGGPQRPEWLLARISPETGRPMDVCAFRVEDAGVGDYFGFTLDGDGRFLLADFTVTHNTTVLLQASQTVAESTKRPVLYTSGEQNADDVGIFAARLGIKSELIAVRGNEGDVYKITSEAERLKPALIVCDSVQTAFVSDVGGDVGSAEQIKAVTNWLTSFGKVEKVSVIIVCHVNKDGEMAGPRVMEHLVDAICYLDPYGGPDGEDEDEDEGETDLEFLASLREFSIGKNRFGAPGLRAVVQMTSRGIHTPDKPISNRLILPK